MQLALTILAGFGALLFVGCFLAYVFSGFRHHFVTGLISMLPILNVITLPSLWDKNSKKFIVGFIGLIITCGAWFLGADKGIQNLIQRGGNATTEEVVITSSPKASTYQTTNTAPVSSQTKRIRSYDEENMLVLPAKALYKLGFDIVPIDQIASLNGRIVQITKTNNELVEGRIKAIAAGSVIVTTLSVFLNHC